MKGVFVTGTDTNIGKTVCSAVLVSALLEEGKAVSYWKPVQTGPDSDRDTVLELSGLPPEHAPLPLYQYPEPMAPVRAAALHEEEITLETIQSCWRNQPPELFWIVEGAGGILVPIAGTKTMADLAAALGLPLIIAASPKLGGMNHCLLTLGAAHHRGLQVEGVVWVGNEDPGIEESLKPWLLDIPWVQRIPWLSSLTQATIHQAARRIPCFPRQ